MCRDGGEKGGEKGGKSVGVHAAMGAETGGETGERETCSSGFGKGVDRRVADSGLK